jgi:hypothetical protein
MAAMMGGQAATAVPPLRVAVVGADCLPDLVFRPVS